MRRTFRAVEKDLHEALTVLGYRKTRQTTSGSEWRRQRFHLIIRGKGKSRLNLHLHIDMASSYPPFHRAVHTGRDVTAELDKILEAYKRRRAAIKRD